MPHLALSLSINAVDATLHFGFACTKCDEFIDCWEVVARTPEDADECLPSLRAMPISEVLDTIQALDEGFIRILTTHDYHRHEIPRQAALN